MKPHTCPDWEEGIEKIDSIFRVSERQGQPYTGPTFHYCPWCGEKLKKDEPEQEKKHRRVKAEKERQR